MIDEIEGRQEMAGHLLAELQVVQDCYHLGQIETEAFVRRVREIRRRARSGKGGLLENRVKGAVVRTFAQIDLHWEKSMSQAGSLTL